MVLLYPVQTKALHLQHGGSAAVDSTPDMDSSLLKPKHVAVEVDRIEPPAMTLSRSLVLLVTGALLARQAGALLRVCACAALVWPL